MKKALGAAKHFARRTPGERQQKNAARFRALRNRPSHAMHERRGLAGSCSGDDQQGPVSKGCGLPLLRIQTGQQFVDRLDVHQERVLIVTRHIGSCDPV